MRLVGSTVVNMGVVAASTANWASTISSPDLISAIQNTDGIVLRHLSVMHATSLLNMSVWLGTVPYIFPGTQFKGPLFIPPGVSLGLGKSASASIIFSYDKVPA